MSNLTFIIIILVFLGTINAQEIRVIDNKGTIKTVFKPTIAERYDIAGNFTISSEGDVLNNGVIMVFDTGGIINLDDFSSTTTSITVLNAGTYKISYRITAEMLSSNNRSGTEYILLKNNNVVPGSYSAAYHRSGNSSKNTAIASRVLILAANDELKVRGNKYAGVGDILTAKQGSSFLVERIE
jgi:hypothetical protein